MGEAVPAGAFSVSVGAPGDERVVTIAGELDLYSCPRLIDCLDEAIAAGARRIRLDMRKLTFVDSEGLRTLVNTSRRLGDQGGELILAGPNEATYRILEITGLHKALSVSRR